MRYAMRRPYQVSPSTARRSLARAIFTAHNWPPAGKITIALLEFPVRKMFLFLLSYESKVEGNQKQCEVYEASKCQEIRGHREPEDRNTDLIPRKIPARARGDEERAGEKLTNILPVDSHN
jgi:hypothetical protein